MNMSICTCIIIILWLLYILEVVVKTAVNVYVEYLQPFERILLLRVVQPGVEPTSGEMSSC